MKLKILTTLAAVSLLSACATQEAAPTAAPAAPATAAASQQLPSWVLNPVVEDGFADTQCVSATADMNILKNKAVALARAEIAKQINVSVKAMDKTYQNLTDTAQGSTSGSTFESVSKQVTQAQLSGSRAVKIEYIDFPDKTLKLCALVTLSPAITKSLFDNLVTESSRDISPTNEAVLYQQFLAHKAQSEMDFELEKQNQ